MWGTIPHNIPGNYDATITKLCIRLALSTVHIKYVAKFHTKKNLAGVTCVADSHSAGVTLMRRWGKRNVREPSRQRGRLSETLW